MDKPLTSINCRLKSATFEHWQVKRKVLEQYFVAELLGRREIGLPQVGAKTDELIANHQRTYEN